MDDSLLVRMLHRVAYLNEQLQPFLHADAVLIAVFSDFDPIHQFHDEVGPTRFSRASIKDPRDIGMVHQGQCLALSLEPGDHVFGIHPQLDDLQGYPAANRMVLLRHIDHAATALSKLCLLYTSDAADERSSV